MSGLLRGTEIFELERAVVNAPVADNFFEVISEYIRPEDADDNGRVRAGKSFRGPFDEFREVEQKGRFDLILRRLLLRESSQTEADNQPQKQEVHSAATPWARGLP